MIKPTSGKLFPASQRGLEENQVLKRYSTFNFEKYNNEHAQPFGDLFLCNDESLAGGKLSFFLSRQDAYQIFLPINGRLDIVQGGKEISIDAGQIQIVNAGRGEVLDISNPDLDHTINYLQFGINTDMFLLRASEMLFSFNLKPDQNHLIPIVSHFKLPFKISKGLFTEHNEVTYQMQNKQSRFFCLVIDGKFEIKGQLLHARYALSLWDLEQVKLKAKSDNSIILIVEFGS